MMMRPPPIPPCWPMYPEPERSRLKASYRSEHAAYCDEMDRNMRIDLSAFAFGLLLLVPAIWYLT